jgi:hypothetical protein
LSIAEWEDKHGNSDPEWDYYQQWLLALERQLIKASLLGQQELDDRAIELLEGEKGAV